MSPMKRESTAKRTNKRQRQEQPAVRNDELFQTLVRWFVPPGELFQEGEFHGNVKWNAEEVLAQALIWSWQEAKNVTDAFDQTREICDDLGVTARGLPGLQNYQFFFKHRDHRGHRGSGFLCVLCDLCVSSFVSPDSAMVGRSVLVLSATVLVLAKTLQNAANLRP